MPFNELLALGRGILDLVSTSSPGPINQLDESRPLFRYDAQLAEQIETTWQERWEANKTYQVANPGDSPESLADSGETPSKLFIMDMFPYPSGSGLHVGHPLGYIGTDVFARYKRMKGYHVLHTMGYDVLGYRRRSMLAKRGILANTETNIAIATPVGQA